MGRSFSGMQYCATLKPLLLLRSPWLAVGTGDTNAMATAKTAILILIDMPLLPKFERSVFADWIANRVALFPSLWRVITSTVGPVADRGSPWVVTVWKDVTFTH
jgi:hypothetical protein